MTRVFRFAPSPNGLLHRGHALSALLNFEAARAVGGRFLLRIEDIDTARARPEFEQAIFEDLAWLGLSWEEPVLRQSARFPVYRQALARLQDMGLVYPTFLSRAEIRQAVEAREASGTPLPRDPDGAPHYPGDERTWDGRKRADAIATGRPHALRLDMARALAGAPTLTWREADPFGVTADTLEHADPTAWGDVVLARSDTPASYHLCVTVDDAFQGVTDVVRGLDLKPATAVHRLLQHLLGLPEPRYFHHRLVLDEAGRKLSKSDGAESLRSLREAGATPDDIRRSVGL